MSLLYYNFESYYLHGNTDVNVILPDRPHGDSPEMFFQAGKKYPVLWLFHGTYGDYSDWIRKTNIELYASEHNLIVVMPSAINTYYENWPGFGCGYYTEDYIVRELMPFVQNWLPASGERSDNYVAGLSMGSAGALRFLERYPEHFSGGIFLSSFPIAPEQITEQILSVKDADYHTVETEARFCTTPFEPAFQALRLLNGIQNAGGADNYVKQYDLWSPFAALTGREDKPTMYFACGTEDPNYQNFLAFRNYAENLHSDAHFVEAEGMAHEWRFWDEQIEKGVIWLNPEKN